MKKLCGLLLVMCVFSAYAMNQNAEVSSNPTEYIIKREDKQGNIRRILFNVNEKETFSMDTFDAGIKQALNDNKAYVLAVTKTKTDDGKPVYHFYDGRQLVEFYKRNPNEYKDLQTNIVIRPRVIRYYDVDLKKRHLHRIATQADLINRTPAGEALLNVLGEARIDMGGEENENEQAVQQAVRDRARYEFAQEEINRERDRALIELLQMIDRHLDYKIMWAKIEAGVIGCTAVAGIVGVTVVLAIVFL